MMMMMTQRRRQPSRLTRRASVALLLLLPAPAVPAPPPPPPTDVPAPQASAPAASPPVGAPGPWDVRLGARETGFRTRGSSLTQGRAHNLRRAAALLDGVVIPAGGELGYNRLLGPRTLRRGWRKAKAFLGGEVVEEPGGGICQVSSTLHAAALEAGLVARAARPHSRVVPYIEPGLDATVSWRAPDLVLFNPHPFPVRVSASEPEPGRLRVEVLGKSRLWDVSVRLVELERYSGATVRRPRPDRPLGWRRVAEPGSPHVVVVREVVRRALGTGGVEVESRVLSYEPSNRVLEVGTGTGP